MTDQEIRHGRRQAHNLYDSDGTQIGAMFTEAWGVRIVGGYNAGNDPADRERKLECPALACAYSFFGPTSERQLVEHHATSHDPNRPNDWRQTLGWLFSVHNADLYARVVRLIESGYRRSTPPESKEEES
jgi:hypothetical protein